MGRTSFDPIPLEKTDVRQRQQVFTVQIDRCGVAQSGAVCGNAILGCGYLVARGGLCSALGLLVLSRLFRPKKSPRIEPHCSPRLAARIANWSSARYVLRCVCRNMTECEHRQASVGYGQECFQPKRNLSCRIDYLQLTNWPNSSVPYLTRYAFRLSKSCERERWMSALCRNRWACGIRMSRSTWGPCEPVGGGGASRRPYVYRTMPPWKLAEWLVIGMRFLPEATRENDEVKTALRTAKKMWTSAARRGPGSPLRTRLTIQRIDTEYHAPRRSADGCTVDLKGLFDDKLASRRTLGT